MSQLSFQFQDKSGHYPEEEFILLPENLAAVNFLKKFFAQDNFSKAQFPSVIIRGEAASGKSHLLHKFSQEFAVEFLDKEKISGANLSTFFAPNHFYVLENIHKIESEELILHVINSASEASSFLVLTSLPQTQFALKDLSSRLKNISSAEIKNPSLESVKQLLAKGLSRTQIKLSGKAIEFVSNNINRSYEAIEMAVKKIEFYCQENGQNVSVKALGEMF
jgi:chromosomal replication initiation ATPase DnaA